MNPVSQLGQGSGLKLSRYPGNLRLNHGCEIEIGVGDLYNFTIYRCTEHIYLFSTLNILCCDSTELMLLL